MAFRYSPKIVTDGLVLCLDAANPKSFVSGSTTWNDLTTNFNNGILTNGPFFNGENGGSIVFDGVDDYVDVVSTVNVGNPNTIIATFKLSGSNVDSVIYGPTANDYDNWLGVFSDKIRFFGTQTANVNNFSLVGTTTLNTLNTTWYQVASVINGNTATIYLNGLQEGTTTQAFTIGAWASNVSIGKRGFVSQRYFKGAIASVQAYNRALSDQEILQNYNATKTRFGL